MAKRKPKNKLKKFINLKIPELLIISGIFLVILSLSHNYLRNRALRLESDLLSAYQEKTPLAADPTIPVHIEIPWNTSAKITSQVYVEGQWTIAQDSVSYLSSSARPAEPGNIIMYGHNRREILGNIRALKGGERVTLTLQNGSKRVYQVFKVIEVSPNKTELLMPTHTETLTLYTCSGPLDSLRYVVQAKPLIDQVVEF